MGSPEPGGTERTAGPAGPFAPTGSAESTAAIESIVVTAAPSSSLAPFAAGGLRFACQPDCGACCSRPGQVRLDRSEARAMAAALGLGQAEFRRRWVLNAGGALRLVDGPDGACPFLGEDRRCRVYAARPAQCRRYPFWPELLADASTWEWEALRCPGIGQGPLIPAEAIAVWGA